MPSDARPRSSLAARSRGLVWVGVIGALFLGVGSAAAADDPGDGSAPDQYQEEIPTSTGSEPTDDAGGSDQGGAAPSGGSSSGDDGGAPATGDVGSEPGGQGSAGARNDRMTGSGDTNGWTNYAPLTDAEGSFGPPEPSSGVSGAVSAVGEGSPHVLALLLLAALLPLAAFAAVTVRAHRRRV